MQRVLDVCRSARTILGANGITMDYPVMRHMANLESVLTYEGASEVHTLIVGHAVTGIPAFRHSGIPIVRVFRSCLANPARRRS